MTVLGIQFILSSIFHHFQTNRFVSISPVKYHWLPTLSISIVRNDKIVNRSWIRQFNGSIMWFHQPVWKNALREGWIQYRKLPMKQIFPQRYSKDHSKCALRCQQLCYYSWANLWCIIIARWVGIIAISELIAEDIGLKLSEIGTNFAKWQKTN